MDLQQKGTLYFFCGKMGAGKSTLAKSLAEKRRGVLISEDEWLAQHYPHQIDTFDDFLKHSKAIKPFIKSHVQRILQAGCNVVMDFSANTQRQRSWFKQLCAQIDCQHELIYVDVSDQQCLQQIAKRRIEQPQRAKFDTEDVFRQVTRLFEPPTVQEELNIMLSTAIQ